MVQNKNSLQLLHISDLQIRKEKNKNTNVNQIEENILFDSFLKRLEQDKERYNIRPDLVIISGDIASRGIKEEYETATLLINTLLTHLGLEKDRVFITPGNHDVDRSKYRSSDIPNYFNISELNSELTNLDYRSDLFKGMADYFSFIKKNYPHVKSIDKNLVPFVFFLQSDIGNIAFAGLNSAWMCRRSPDREEIAIGEYQMKKAYQEIRKQQDIQLIINVFHHPVEWLWPRDRRICRMYFHNSICLTGHLHGIHNVYTIYTDNNIQQFQTGGLYLHSHSGIPNRYQYITITHDKIRLDFRKFSKNTRKWILDGDMGDDGVKLFTHFSRFRKTNDSLIIKIEQNVKEFVKFNSYMSAVYNDYKYLPGESFNFSLPVQIKQIYINMRAFIHITHQEQRIEPGDLLEAESKKNSINNVDIKYAFTLLKANNIKDMIILGDPGAGKTTLLKYIIINLIEGRGEDIFGLSSQLIPFYAPFRETKNPKSEDFYTFMARVCNFDERGVTQKDFQELLKNGKAIIFLDGLDEVTPGKRLEVIQWVEKARRIYHKVHFIITSRFAGYTGKYRLDGNLIELAIDDFSQAEIKEFLYNWYMTVESFLHNDNEYAKRKGEAEAENLYTSIIESGPLRQLVKNPLLLQVAALIHPERTHLPTRRVELFEECTDILLEKWDMVKGLDVHINARKALSLLQPVALWLHQQDQRRTAKLEEIIEVIQKSLDEHGKTRMDAKKLLMNIRDRSGIFTKFSHDEYGFIHLSFQEYLAALEIRNRGDISLLVNNYTNRWWREVILLTLALDNPSIIGEFIKRIIQTKAFCSEITLVQDALTDSRIKPIEELKQGLLSKELPQAAKSNILILLNHLAEHGIESAKNLLSTQTSINDKQGFEYIKNPYRSGNLIQELHQGNTNMFFGRKETIHKLKQILINDDEGVIFIYGQRRAGKSCLLKYIEMTNQFAPDLSVIFIDMQGISSEYEFYTKVIKQILKKINSGNKNHPHLNSFANFSNTLDLLTGTSNSRILFMIDEFEHILDKSFTYNSLINTDDFIKKLRNIIQYTSSVKFVIAGTKGLKDMVNDYHHPFFKAGQTFDIAALSPGDAIDLITKPLSGIVSYTDRAVELVQQATFNHPYYIQLLCYIIVSILNKEKTNIVTVTVVKRAIDQIEKQEPDIFEYVWQVTNRESHLVLSIIAEKMTTTTWIPLELIERIIIENKFILSDDIINGPIPDLVEKQFITENENMEYTIPIGLLYIWIKRYKSLKRVRREFKC